MFKKIEIWILYLILFLFFPLLIVYGSLVRHEMVGGTALKKVNAGWLSQTALFLAEIPINVKKYFSSELKLPDRFPDLEGFDGEPNNDETYLLLSRYDGDLREGVVELIDLTNFQILHKWNPDINKFNKLVKKIDEFKYLNRDGHNARHIPRHPILLNDGGLVFRSLPLRKINECSDLVFQVTKDAFDHSLELDKSGNIWARSYLYPQTIDEKIVGRETLEQGGYYDDAIVKLSPDGEILFEKSVSQIFIDNGLDYLLFANGNDYENDPIHLNDIQPVDFDGDFWKKGDVFLSMRNQSMVLLYRPSTNKIIWKGNGPFFHQHDVDIIDDHRIAIFNNNSINVVGNTNIVNGHNEVNIYNFKTEKYSSYLKSSLEDYDVRTVTQGRSEILPNGDLFIEESEYARTLYFNSDGSLRWSHINRARDGKLYRLGWSRILYSKNDILTVNSFLKKRGKCDL